MPLLRLLLVAALMVASPVNAQKVSLARDAFLSDINSLAGVSRTGSVLLAADPNKKKWGDYCAASQTLARQGEFRQAIRTAAMALYLGESANGNYGAPIIYASNDIASAYSYAGDHAAARLWADRTLAAIGKGYENWAREGVALIKANAFRVRALALGSEGRHADAVAEMEKGLDALPATSGRLVKAEFLIALASLQTRAGAWDRARETVARVLVETDPLLRTAAHRAAGDLALARKDAAAASGYYRIAEAAASEGGRRDDYQLAMVRLGQARAARLGGDNAAAASALTGALAALEGLRGSFSSFELRTALYGNLQGVFDEAVSFYEARGDTEAALAASEASRARAMLDLQGKFAPTGVAPPAVRPRSLREIQSRLAGAQTLVVYHQLPDRLVAWVVTRDTMRAQSLPLAAVALHGEVGRMRAMIEKEDRSLAGAAQGLYTRLVQPLQIADGAELVFVPHKSLHLLPFQALHDGSRWLVERHPVATAMSASLFENAAAGVPGSLAALGNPDLGKAEWALPGAEAEVKAIQGLYASSSVFVQKEASKAHLLSSAPGAGVVHVAAHAVVDEVDPMYSTIKLATTGLAGADMEAREFASLNLSGASLVTLSACNSGVGKVADGDEFMGFKRAVIAAGAKSALVSLWPVDDESTQMLMTRFHQSWKSMTRARAMQAAQLSVLTNPKYAHPFYWAAFTLVGAPD